MKAKKRQGNIGQLFRLGLRRQQFKQKMKTKNRKKTQDFPENEKSNLLGREPFKLKFDILKNDISCFFSKKPNSKIGDRRVSKSIKKGVRADSQKKAERPKIVVPELAEKEANVREGSPDLVRDVSNIILSKIEKEGISSRWEEERSYKQISTTFKQDEDSILDQSLWSAFEEGFGDKSFASTNDTAFYPHIYSTYSQDQTISIRKPSSFEVNTDYIYMDWRTTLMIRNIPNKYSIHELSSQIDASHEGTYDFLYLPCDLKNNCNMGYGFINFTDVAHLYTFYEKFDNYIWKKYRSEKICMLTYARLQGLEQLIEHFENSKVLNQKEKKYRPIIKYQEIHKIVHNQQQMR